MAVRVLYDANVLFSRTVRDWLLMLQLETGGRVFVGCWTEDILAEVVHGLRRADGRRSGGDVSRLRDRIAEVLEGGRIEDYDCTVEYTGVDPDDRHVHAAAIAGDVGILVTDDQGLLALRDDARLPYDVMSSDDFLVLVGESAPAPVTAVAEKQLEHAITTGRDTDLAGRLNAAGCPAFAGVVRRVLQQLALRP